MDKPMNFNEWMGKQGNLALIHANCCRVAYEAGQNSMQVKVDSLKGQLIKLGFTDNGGQLMKPPLGNAPRFDLLDELRSSIEILAQKYKHDAHASSLFGDQDKARIYNCIANQLALLLKGGA